MQHHAANQLHIVVNHIPRNHIAAGHPLVLVVGHTVGVDADALARGRQVAVVVVGGDHNFLVFSKAARRILHHGEGFGQYFVQHFLGLVVRSLVELVDALVEAFLLVDRHIVFVFNAFAQRGQFSLLLAYFVLDAFLEFYSLGAQLVVGEFLDRRIDLEGGFEVGIDLLEVALRFAAKEFG